MARTVMCDEDDGQPATVMLSNLDTGDVVAICAQHWPAFVRALAEALAPGAQEMPPQEAEAAAEAAAGGETAPNPPGTKRRRAARASAEQALASDASPLRDATPIDS